jgi:hypothetical protein
MAQGLHDALPLPEALSGDSHADSFAFLGKPLELTST